jgi:hypothetical protein
MDNVSRRDIPDRSASGLLFTSLFALKNTGMGRHLRPCSKTLPVLCVSADKHCGSFEYPLSSEIQEMKHMGNCDMLPNVRHLALVRQKFDIYCILSSMIWIISIVW